MQNLSPAFNRKVSGLPRHLVQFGAQVDKGCHGFTVDGGNAVSLPNPGFGSGARAGAVAERLSIDLRRRDTRRFRHSWRVISVRIRQPSCNSHRIQHNQTNQNVHQHPTGQHKNALPPRLIHHGVGALILIYFIHGRHTSNVAEATKWNSFKAIFNAFTVPLHHGGTKTHIKTTHFHAARQSGAHMTPLMQGDSHHDAQRKQRDTTEITHHNEPCFLNALLLRTARTSRHVP